MTYVQPKTPTSGFFTSGDPREAVTKPTTVPPAPAPAPAPAPTPKPSINQTSPAPSGATITSTQQNYPTGGGTPATQVPAPANDIRGTMISPTPSAGTQHAAGAADQVANRLTGYQFSPWQSVGPANYGGARDYFSQAAGAAGGMNLGQYGEIAGNDYAKSYGLLNQAAGAAGQPGGPAGDTGAMRDMVFRMMQGMEGAPDRTQLALNAMDRMERASQPGYEQTLRTVGQKNAALGRLGSGMVTNQLMDVTAQRERDLALARGQLADSAAGQTLSDRLNMLGASQGVFGQLGGEDRAWQGLGLQRASAQGQLAGQFAGLDQARRGELTGERDFQFGADRARADLAGQRAGLYSSLGQSEGALAGSEYGQRAAERDGQLRYGLDQFDAQSGLFGQMAGLEGQRFAQDVTGRNEMRGEREWQNTMAQQGMTNAMQQQLMQEQFFGNDYNRWLDTMRTMGSLGFSGGDPSGAQLDAAGQYGQQGQQGAAGFGDLMQNWSYQEWLKRNGGIAN